MIFFTTPFQALCFAWWCHSIGIESSHLFFNKINSYWRYDFYGSYPISIIFFSWTYDIVRMSEMIFRLLIFSLFFRSFCYTYMTYSPLSFLSHGILHIALFLSLDLVQVYWYFPGVSLFFWYIRDIFPPRSWFFFRISSIYKGAQNSKFEQNCFSMLFGFGWIELIELSLKMLFLIYYRHVFV